MHIQSSVFTKFHVRAIDTIAGCHSIVLLIVLDILCLAANHHMCCVSLLKSHSKHVVLLLFSICHYNHVESRLDGEDPITT